MKKTFFIITIFLLCAPKLIFAQNIENKYRSAENPYYWKNRNYADGYWQQDVHYKIKATLDEKTDILIGEETLVYWNNSPNTLNYVYFHLYANAFLPDSYLNKVSKQSAHSPKIGKYGEQGLGIVIEKITVNNKEVKTELDNTILKVYLPEPLKSGEYATFQISFKTYFDLASGWRRMSVFFVDKDKKYKHYNGTQWYPKICVYDRKFGWATDQHLGKEFYGDFGTFDVELTLTNNFIVEATGELVNKDEVLPPALREKLDIKNFRKKPWGEAPSEIIPYDSTKKKTWIYHAENVHDFAFTADPTYRIGETEWQGIKSIAVVQESHAIGWQNAAETVKKIIQMLSENFGMYCYPKMVVADANQGMEYPMLTLCSGFDPYYKYVLIHEIGHNWFYGMLGSNETYRAVMDEGFTQFLTVWCLDKFKQQGEMIDYPHPMRYIKRYTTELNPIYEFGYLPYLQQAITFDDEPLNLHADYYKSWKSYRINYYKGATMLYNLQYVLGDSLFWEAMRNYFDEWKFRHPYPEDFRNSIIQFTQVDLNWFFDYWLETNEDIDYAVKSIKRGKEKDEYLITFKRKTPMQMPIDFELISRKDSVYKFHIPNTWFVKETDATVLPRWLQWGVLNLSYEAKVAIPNGIKNVRIDPSGRLADINLLDNSKKFPMKIKFDSQLQNPPDWRNYELFIRPELWYNGFDGFKTGVHLNGNYMNYKHIFTATFWYNTTLAQQKLISEKYKRYNTNDLLSLHFTYKTGLDKVSKNSSVYLLAQHLDGLRCFSAEVDKKNSSGNNRIYLNLKSMFRRYFSDLNYLIYPEEWGHVGDTIYYPSHNNIGTIGFETSMNKITGPTSFNIKLRTSFLSSDYNFSYLSFSTINSDKLWRLQLRSRFYWQYGFGSNWAKESSLFLAGANPEEMMDNKFTRSIGFFDNTWFGFGNTTNHFHYGGGLNLRGYAGYYCLYEKNGKQYFTYRGNTGIAANFELEFDRLIKFKPKFHANIFTLNTYLFSDLGVIDYNVADDFIQLANFRVDAGIGAALTIKRWGYLEKIKPLTIRFDMPLFLNTPPYLEKFFQFRWIIGVGRAF